MEQLEVKQKQKLGKERDLSFDVMNILACISVIALHHNNMVHTFVPTAAWAQSLVAECVFYWAVPVFMMISGANLLGYRDRYDTRTFFKKRIQRTVIPWLAWSFLLLTWKVIGGSVQLNDRPLQVIMEQVFYYKIEPIYWFFGELFACYLAMPVFSLLCRERKALWYVVALNFVFLSCLPALGIWVRFPWSLDVPVVGSLIIYVLLGYLLNTGELSRKQRTWIYVTGLASMLFRYFYTYHFSYLQGFTDTSIKGYLQFHSVLYAVAAFVWLNQVPWDKILSERVKELIPRLASHSYGVFLVHRVVIYYELRFLPLGNDHLIWRTFCVFGTYIFSVLIVAGLKKLPIIKYIMG